MRVFSTLVSWSNDNRSCTGVVTISLILVLCNYAGDKFDLKEFHDAVLLESALPMSILEELIEQYISAHK